MTCQDFIVNYNETFKYIHERYGKAAVIALWNYLGETGLELCESVRERGLDGYYEFFYGSEGTCSREEVEGGAYIDKDGVFHEIIDGCPSVGELEERGKRPYRYYCEHCYWLYRKSLEENGYSYEASFELQPRDEGYVKKCSFRSFKRKAKED